MEDFKMNEWDGKNRRKGDVAAEHRFTVLESIAATNQKGISDLESKTEKNKEIILMETRLQTEELKEFMIATINVIKTDTSKMNTNIDAMKLKCEDHGKRIAELKTFGALVEKLAYVFGGAITAIGGWLFTHHDKIKAVKP